MIAEATLDRLKTNLLKTDQNAKAVESMRKLLEQMEKPMEMPALNLEKQLFFQAMNKKIVANSDMLRQVSDQFKLMQSSQKSTEKPSFNDGATGNSFRTPQVLEKKLQCYDDMSLEQFLQTALGQKLGFMLAMMTTPSGEDWQKLENWWISQKTRWSKKDPITKKDHLPQWYRAVAWWSAQFMETWTRVITDFMINPFQTSLQEICHQATMAKNLLIQMGFIVKEDTKFKWAEPFICMGKFFRSLGSAKKEKSNYSYEENEAMGLTEGKSVVKILFFVSVKRLTEKTDLKIGMIKEILMVASPRHLGPSWVTNRENEQWTTIAGERIFAMSSSCDKKEFNPPTRGLNDAFPTALMHLAEIHHQLAEEQIQASVTRFESFIKSIKMDYPSYEEFRNSDLFGEFDDDQINEQYNSTPTVDEMSMNDFAPSELDPKRVRYY